MKIPLVRPVMPDWDSIWLNFKCAYKTRTFSNFGEIFYKASRALKKQTGMECLPVSTGTAAIELACRLKFKPGERILVPCYTHIGTLQAVRAAGCIPVFGYTDANTWVLKQSVPYGVSGAVVVSPFGYPVDFSSWDEFAREQGIGLVYDLAGGWGMGPETLNPVCYSLHATKNFSCGEGGVLAVSSRPEWERARWYSNFCNEPDRTVNTLDGANHKPSELLCAVILSHLSHADRIIHRASSKAAALKMYREKTGLFCPDLNGAAPSLCVLQGLTEKQAQKLVRMGIDVRQYYPPFPQGLAVGLAPPPFEILSRYALPSDVTEEELDHVIQAVKRVMA